VATTHHNHFPSPSASHVIVCLCSFVPPFFSFAQKVAGHVHVLALIFFITWDSSKSQDLLCCRLQDSWQPNSIFPNKGINLFLCHNQMPRKSKTKQHETTFKVKFCLFVYLLIVSLSMKLLGTISPCYMIKAKAVYLKSLVTAFLPTTN
jgi:hypothetical protein